MYMHMCTNIQCELICFSGLVSLHFLFIASPEGGEVHLFPTSFLLHLPKLPYSRLFSWTYRVNTSNMGRLVLRDTSGFPPNTYAAESITIGSLTSHKTRTTPPASALKYRFKGRSNLSSTRTVHRMDFWVKSVQALSERYVC